MASRAQEKIDADVKRRQDFAIAATPLIKWLAENTHPHHVAHVTCTDAELFEGQIRIINQTFLKD